MAVDWVIVYSTNQVFEAGLIKEMLLEHEIECVTVNKQDSAYLIGDIEVYVPTTDAFKATQLISKFKGE